MIHHLPKKYHFISSFDTGFLKKIDKETAIIYRNYNIGSINLVKLLNLKNFLKKKNIRFYLSNNFKLAIKNNFDGVYLPSFNKDFSHLACKIKPSFIILGSAHNLKEIRIKELQGVKLIFISSLFKKNKNYLGINKFKNMKNLTKKKIIALGGINEKNKKKINLVNCYGFSGISYFK